MMLRQLFIIVLLALTQWSCSGRLQVAAEAQYWQANTSVDTLLSVFPSLPATAEPWCTDWLDLLTEAAALNGITLQLITPDSLWQYTGRELDALTQLRQQIEWALAGQEFGRLESRRQGLTEVYATAPRLVGDFGAIGQRYVALQGVRTAVPEPQQVTSLFYSEPLQREGNLQGIQYYLVVADLQRGLIVYREVRNLRPRPHCALLKSVFYDSYKHLLH